MHNCEEMFSCATAVTAVGMDLVYVAESSPGISKVNEVVLKKEKLHLVPEIRREIELPSSSIPSSLFVDTAQNKLLLADIANTGGLYMISLTDGIVCEKILDNANGSSIHSVVKIHDDIVYSDVGTRQIKCLKNMKVTILAGIRGTKFGTSSEAFVQPSSIICEGNTLFVLDTGSACLQCTAAPDH